MGVRMDLSGLKKLRDELQKAGTSTHEAFFEDCAKELAARLLAKVITRTPVGKYKGDKKRYKRDNEKTGVKKGDLMKTKTGKQRYERYKTVAFTTKRGETVNFRADMSGKVGGTLRRGWTAKSHEEAASGSGRGLPSREYAESLTVSKSGGVYTITITNPVKYANYVDKGHRTRDHKDFVRGKHFVKISEEELQAQAPNVIQKKLEKYLQEAFGG